MPAVAAGLHALGRPVTATATDSKSSSSPKIKFFGSQIGGESAISYCYTDMPVRLICYDVYYFFVFLWALPYIVFPLTPSDSRELCELSVTRQNLFCVAVHFLLCVLQLGFLIALPFMVMFPVWLAGLGMGLFFLVNKALCMLINGVGVEFHSDERLAPPRPEHAHEQWIFINGVAVGRHWMKGNLNRLALTFKRPILGIHNKTDGIIFDVLECLIQRNLGYATEDVRVCYKIIKQKLYNPKFSKIIFVLHSQGAIEGSMILDWILQELPQDVLAKLEVYTFGNAANHFNNPYRIKKMQVRAFRRPMAESLGKPGVDGQNSERDLGQQHANTDGKDATSRSKSLQCPLSRFPHASASANPPLSFLPNTSTLASETSAARPSAVSGRAIGHIEHYAHTTDFVALWGVLHFATSRLSSRIMPRFIGRVFERTSARGGHQLVQHYLDGMFPLKLQRDEKTGLIVGGDCLEEGNEFMESDVVVGQVGENEALESSWLGGGFVEGKDLTEARSQEEVRNGSVELTAGERGRFRLRSRTTMEGPVKYKVKELSRLWQYRNGRSPRDTPPYLAMGADRVLRGATM